MIDLDIVAVAVDAASSIVVVVDPLHHSENRNLVEVDRDIVGAVVAVADSKIVVVHSMATAAAVVVVAAFVLAFWHVPTRAVVPFLLRIAFVQDRVLDLARPSQS